MKPAKSAILLLTYLLLSSIGSAQSPEEKAIDSINNESFLLKDSDLKKAFRLSDTALKMVKNRPVSILKSNVYSVRGTLFQLKNEYEPALDWHFKALKIRQYLKDTLKTATSEFNIANAYYEAGQYKRAREFHLRSLNTQKKQLGITAKCIKNYNSLGALLQSMGKIDSAKYYYKEALKIISNNALSDSVQAKDVYLNLGILYEGTKEFDSGILYLSRAEQIQLMNDDLAGLALTYHHIGIINELKMNFSLAKTYYSKAYSIAQKQMDLEAKRDISMSLMMVYSKEKNSDSSLYFLEQYRALNEDVLNVISDKNILEIEAKYQTKIKDQQLKLSREETKRKEFQKQQITTSFILGSIIVIAILSFLIRNYRQKQRIANMQVDLKNREINELLTQQETASYAAMLEGQDHERLRIAQDLHDRLGSTLAAIKLGMQGDPVSTNNQNQRLVDTAITEVRSIAHNLSGGNIERYGFNVALNELKTTIEKSGTMHVHLYLEAVMLTNQLSIELYRMVQELISNTLKHAHASEITIQTNNHEDSMNLIYEDNGVGFDTTTATEGMGIRSIHRRLDKWEGTFVIDTQPGRGTIIIIQLPKTSLP